MGEGGVDTCGSGSRGGGCGYKWEGIGGGVCGYRWEGCVNIGGRGVWIQVGGGSREVSGRVDVLPMPYIN